jgi:hypothetical protein
MVIGTQGFDHRCRRIEAKVEIRRLLPSNGGQGIETPEDQSEACYQEENVFHERFPKR